MKPTTPSAQLALDTIMQKHVKGIPSWIINPMEHSILERLAEVEPGEYRKNPEPVYLKMLINMGTCLNDQFIPENPLCMGDKGYEGSSHGATTGSEEIMCDGMVIDSPEAMVEHLEKFEFQRLKAAAENFDIEKQVRHIIDMEASIQERIGPTMLKSGYGFIGQPYFRYGQYGYVNYFSAYALYPDVIEKDFSLQADLALKNNIAAARAYKEADLAPLYRLDHDMADSRGTLVHIDTLDKMWFPHVARCLEPMLKTNVKMIWHCDGNLSQMVPRLLDCGLRGFQGFQYEDGMDYEQICKMKTRDGDDLFIIGGVSVTRTLPNGTPTDVKREIDWLVKYGPKTGLVLGCTSSIAPGVPWENIKMLKEGFAYYREHGRGNG